MADKTIADLLTGGNVVNGVFNEMMDAVNADIETQWDKGRINGVDFATVYLGALQTTLQQAVQYVLSENKANSDAALAAAEATLIGYKSETENAQTADKMIDGVTDVTGMVNAVKTTETSKQDKLSADETLVKTKAVSEQAQYKDNVKDIDGTSPVVVYTPKTADNPASGKGLIGKQQVLYNKQTDGFDRDAEQKLLKIAADIHSVLISANTGVDAAPTEFKDFDAPNNATSGIGEIIVKAKTGVGIS